ncbi:MAG: hypothetical protein WCS42_27830, partial [Verrucomicrobiota bacterium]
MPDMPTDQQSDPNPNPRLDKRKEPKAIHNSDRLRDIVDEHPLSVMVALVIATIGICFAYVHENYVKMEQAGVRYIAFGKDDRTIKDPEVLKYYTSTADIITISNRILATHEGKLDSNSMLDQTRLELFTTLSNQFSQKYAGLSTAMQTQFSNTLIAEYISKNDIQARYMSRDQLSAGISAHKIEIGGVKKVSSVGGITKGTTLLFWPEGEFFVTKFQKTTGGESLDEMPYGQFFLFKGLHEG